MRTTDGRVRHVLCFLFSHGSDVSVNGRSDHGGKAANETLQSVDPLSPDSSDQQYSDSDENGPSGTGNRDVVIFDPPHATAASDE